MKYDINYNNIKLNIVILMILYVVFVIITTTVNPLKWDTVVKILYLYISQSFYFKLIKNY